MPHTLLLADDSVTIQRVIELTFADEDVDVVAVSNGDQAIERLEASPPDIVLADIGMPGRNGYEVAKYIKQTPRLSHIPVVLLTGAFEPVDQERATESGCDGVLAKPFEPQLVIGRVRELLQKGGRAPHAVFSPGVPPPPKDPTPVPPTPSLDESLAAVPVAPATPTPADIGDYFDRLDAAFANLPSQPAARAAKGSRPPAATIAEDIDWFGADRASRPTLAEQWDLPAPAAREDPVDLPLSYASASNMKQTPSGLSEQDLAGVGPAQAGPHAVEPPAAPAKPAAPPPLADAFAALLAAEQDEPTPALAPTWPAAAAAPPAITDDVIEEVVRRVLDRLSDRVVRETVKDIVSTVAERLVKEEIARIKSSIK